MRTLALALAAVLALAIPSARAEVRNFDVVVYGATASGVAAAVSASRQGMHVVLISVDGHVGGMVSGGLSETDKGREEVIGGLSREFFERAGKHYGEPIEWRFEPHIAEQVFRDMLAEAHVTQLSGQRLREQGGVAMRGRKIAAITLTDGTVLRAPVFIDTSYEGDLMNAAGVAYTWGRESAAQYGESIAGVRGKQRPTHQFNVRVSPYADDGSLLPEVQPGPRGEIGQADKLVQAYGFRMCLTNIPGNMLPFPKPANYDPKRYELLKRYIAALQQQTGRAPSMRALMIMTPIKGGKFDINSLGGFSTDHIGASAGFPMADYKQQAAIWQDHYDYGAGFLYFLANDASVPAVLREEMNSYGLARDEFVKDNGWPFQLYIREGRRMLGAYVMTEKDITTDITKSDAIGMGSYQSDSHNVRRIPTPDGAVENEGEQYVVPPAPYEIPYRVMLPKAGAVTNLLVPVCVSASHVAYSTI
ncbi:MAG TPA: FAD-dependent oxidoreductase, partial [Bordetella sp.]|nr:FAD-dependent oxidoreductase [Bordetella sp.]